MPPAYLPCSYDARPLETAAYAADCPAATWRGRLDFRVWGKSSNLFLYFTDLDTEQKWRLSVWQRDDYRPRKNGPDFNKDVTEPYDHTEAIDEVEGIGCTESCMAKDVIIHEILVLIWP